MSLSLFTPVYNEEKILRGNIEKIYSFLEKNFDTFELVIVDDNSSDATGKITKQLLKENKHLRYMKFENGPSRRENLAMAMRTARYNIVGYIDLDLSVPLSYFSHLIEAIEEGVDIALGSRRLKNSKVKRGFYRQGWSTAYHFTIRLLFNSSIRDYQCGFKLFKREVLMHLLDMLSYDKKFQRGWFWDAELLLVAEREKYRIKEIPVIWETRKDSSFNLMRELKVLPYILKLKLAM